MNVAKRILSWLGFGASPARRNAIALRNMPIIAVGSIIAMLFAGMLLVCLVTGISCPVDGFDDAVYDNPATAYRYTVFSAVSMIIMAVFGIMATMYIQRKWQYPRLASILTILFSLVFVMIWGVAVSGRTPESQVLIFASLQFLISGLIVFTPLASLVYFVGSFSLFGFMLNMYGEMASSGAEELAYLAFLDIVVSWIVYGLFRRASNREQTLAEQSRRDELTGAKNRHYLRDDVDTFIGSRQFVMLCDIDDFKHYNDNYGHDEGDLLLKNFYFALREAFGDECTYRYGGDEFLIVSPDFGEKEFLAQTRRCKQQLDLVVLRNGSENGNEHLTFSGGYTFGTISSTEDFREMLHYADEILLDVKRSGKNHVSGRAYAE